MKTLPVGAELFLVDGQTDMTKLIFAIRNFLNARKTAQMLIAGFHGYYEPFKQIYLGPNTSL
jgi:hypothetical protein